MKEGSLPVIEAHRAPWHASWSNSIAMCTTIKDENVTDIREWLTYHQWVGVDHVYLTENGSKAPIRDGLQDFIDSGFVSYHSLEGGQAQMAVYHRCLVQYRSKYNYIAFFDADEYLHVREQGTSLKKILDDYKFFPGLVVHWVFVGPSGMKERPAEGGVLRAYTQCVPEADYHIKTIANTFFVDNISHHPHNMVFRGQAVPVNEKKVPLEYTYGLDPKTCPHHRPSRLCPLVAASKLAPDTMHLASIDRLALFHYATRSAEDFKRKQQRSGGANPVGKPWSFFETYARTQQHHPICEELSLIADICCPLVPADSPAEVARTAARAVPMQASL